MAAMTFKFEFDWTLTGTWVDEASYVVKAKAQGGLYAESTNEGLTSVKSEKLWPLFERIAKPGKCAITLKNSTGRFSPDNAGGALYGQLNPRVPFRLRATDGVTTWTMWRGYTDEIVPQAGAYSSRETLINCLDVFGILANVKTSMGLQLGKRADQLIAGAVNLGMGAPTASGTDTLTSNPSDGDTFTLGTITYRYKNTLSVAFDVKIGATKENTADSLRRAINLDGVSGTDYHSSTTVHPDAYATVASNVLTARARLPGAAGNSIAMSKTGTAQTLSGATLSGGVDYPAGLVSYQTGNEAYDVAADQWSSDEIYVFDILRSIVQSEHGRLFVQRDGTVTFQERRQPFKPLTSVVSLNNDPVSLVVGRDTTQLYNVVQVKVHPRATAGATAVVAQSTGSLRLDPVTPSGPSQRSVTLHFRDPATGQQCGATEIVQPLVPTTDYIVNERKDGTGVDYTNDGAWGFGRIDARGSEITLPLFNSATGPLYINKLQVRGKPVTTYDPLIITLEDAASQVSNLRLNLPMDLPLSADSVFAASLASYLLDRYKQAFTDLRRALIVNEQSVGGVNPFSVNLMDCITATDSQSGISGLKAYVIGITFEIVTSEVSMEGSKLRVQPTEYRLTWDTMRADDKIYWNLGVTGYGELDTNTRLAA